ncbi:Cytochrome P450 4c21, partial [Pseudolycoriella hygida]
MRDRVIKMFILLVISLASFAYLTLKWFRTYSKLRKIQIPDHKLTKFPYFIDMIYSMIKLGITSPENRFTILANICFQHPDIVKTWLGPKMVIFACNPQRIQKVLLSQKCAEKWKLFYSFMDRETGLISARVSLKWKEHRKFFNSCFSLPSIESFVPMFAECCDDCCESLEQIEQRKDFDFLPLAKQLSFSLLCATSLDMKTKDVFEGTNFQEIFEAFEITEAALNYKLEIPYVYPKTIYKLTKLYRSEKKAQALLTVFRTNIMKKRREFMKTVEYNNNEIKNPERIILTDHIIRSEDKFTTKEIDDHFLTFMGGYETVSNAVAHVILLLAMHTEAQDKLYQAIAKAIPSDGDLNNSVIVNGIEYLECVLRESYRLMPTVPIILREVTDDFEIEPNL